MENINRIELRGNIGNVMINEIGDMKVAKVQIVTSTAYRNTDSIVVESTWHNVVVWQGKAMEDVTTISKGGEAYVTGRVRMQRYTSSDGRERYNYEVIADRFQCVER